MPTLDRMATTGEEPHRSDASTELAEDHNEIPEFDVRREDDGRWRGTHRPTGNEIVARSWVELEAMACGVRVIATYRRVWNNVP